MIASSASPSTLRRILTGKSLLLTGATGFIAKAFLEKVLREIPEIGAIYLLVRAEDADHSLRRAEHDIFSSSIFDHLKATTNFKALIVGKIHFVNGDTSQPRLGLHPRDYLLLASEVDLVVNAAASTDFMNRLDHAITTNTISAKYLSEFVAASEKARLLHVSTCYVNEGFKGELEEKLYPQPAARKFLLRAGQGRIDMAHTISRLEKAAACLREQGYSARQLSEKMIEAGWEISRSYGWNNVYTFSKWLGENYLAQSAAKIHCTVLRPSIVESSLHFPHSGWMEGWKVGDPLLYATIQDQIRFFPARADAVMDLIPVDLVCNAMMTAIPSLLTQGQPGLNVLHVCNGDAKNHITVGAILALVRTRFNLRGKSPEPVLISNSVWSVLRVFGYAVLGLLKAIPGTTALRRKLTRVLHLADTYSPYTFIGTTFSNRKLLALHAQLSDEDQENYPVSFGSTKISHYLMQIHIPGLYYNVLQLPVPYSNAEPEPKLRRVP
ncbi:MAG: SDR family oxidoreductase [Bdellovibrionales bacterium]